MLILKKGNVNLKMKALHWKFSGICLLPMLGFLFDSFKNYFLILEITLQLLVHMNVFMSMPLKYVDIVSHGTNHFWSIWFQKISLPIFVIHTSSTVSMVKLWMISNSRLKNVNIVYQLVDIPMFLKIFHFIRSKMAW